MTASLHIILDTDPGIDDAAAIAAALFAPQLDLQLITTVAGNVSVEKTTRNALQLLHFWNSDSGTAISHLPRGPRRRCCVRYAMRHTSTANPVWKAMILSTISANRWRSLRLSLSGMC